MTLIDFAGELRRRWRLFATVFAICVLAAVLLALLVPNRYTASVRLLVTSTGGTTSAAYESLQLEVSRARSYLTLIASDVIAQRVVDDLGLPKSPHDVASGVNGVISADTNIIDVTVTGDTPAQATAIADSLGRQFAQYSAAVETPAASDGKKVVVRTLGPATPAAKERPGPLVFGAIGGLIGVVVGATVVWIRSRADRIVRNPRDVETATGLRVFGPVGDDPSGVRRDQEAYRALAVWMRAVSRIVDDGAQAWLIAGEDDASAAVATGLSGVLATQSDRILIIDARGVEPALSATAKIDVTSVGRGQDGASGTFLPDLVQEAVTAARQPYRTILIIGPGANEPITAAIAARTDAVLVVAVAEISRRGNLSRVANDMRLVGATAAGVVLCSGPTIPSLAGSPEKNEKPTAVPRNRNDAGRLLAKRSGNAGKN